MSQLIITTDLKAIRPIWDSGFTENIKRYNQLKKIFDQDKEYRIFAEPIPSAGDKIAWHTEYNGTIIPFPKLDEQEKEQIKSRLKYQANKLYISILKNIKTKNEQLKLFDLLDACFEIPDYSDIYVIISPNGEKNFTLTRWGFMDENSHKPKQILKSLIALKVNTIKVNVIIGNNKPAINQEVYIKLKDKEKKYITDKNATIILEDFPLLEKFQIYIKEKDTPKYIETYTVNYQNEITYFIGSKKEQRQKVKIIAIDENEQPKPKETLRISYEDIQKEYETDKNGEIYLGEFFINTEITIEQISENKVIKKQTIKVQKGTEKYMFNILKTKKYGLLKIQAIDENGKKLSDILLEIIIANQSFQYKTNEKGLVEIPNVPIKEEVKIRQLENGIPKFQQIIKFDSEQKIYTFVGKNTKLESALGDIIVRVIDKKNNPIKNLRVEIETHERIYSRITNQNGQALFNKMPCKEEMILKIEYRGKKIHNKLNCKADTSNEITIVLGDSKILWWLLIIFLGLLIFGLILLTTQKHNRNLPSPTQNTDTTTKRTHKPQGFQIIVYKDTLKHPAINTFLTIKTKDTVYQAHTDSNGIAIIPELKNYKGELTIIATLKGFPKQMFTFPYAKKKIIYLKKESGETSEIILPCDTTILSKGFHSTIKTFHLTKDKGYLTFIYGTYQIPDKFIIYRGTIADTSNKNIIWQSRFQTGNHKRIFRFEAPDSLITIRVIGGDTVKTEWYFRVNCP